MHHGVPERRTSVRKASFSPLSIGHFCLMLPRRGCRSPILIRRSDRVAGTLIGGERPSRWFRACGDCGAGSVLVYLPITTRKSSDLQWAGQLLTGAIVRAVLATTLGREKRRRIGGRRLARDPLMICTPVCLVVVLPSGSIDWTAHGPGGFLDVSVFSMSWGLLRLDGDGRDSPDQPDPAVAAARSARGCRRVDKPIG
jgi:hypothetical protein